MNGKFAAWAIAAALVLGAAGLAKAQDSTTTQQTTTTTTTRTDGDATAVQDSTANNHSDVRTLTGCLRKGDGAGEYELAGRDGSTWELRSDSVDLASHLGETVTINGAVRNPDMHNMKEDAKKSAEEHGIGNPSSEHGHMTVTDIATVRHGCS